MKKFLILLSVVLTFATTGLFAQAVTEPAATPASNEQSGAHVKEGKHLKKHKKHKKKHHRKHSRKGHKKHHGKNHHAQDQNPGVVTPQ
jgi:Ni/Co efflux regulator RcnB